MRNFAPPVHVGTPATLRTERPGGQLRILAAGDWVIAEVPRLDALLKALDYGTATQVEIDGSAIETLDSAGAWLLLRTKMAVDGSGRTLRRFVVPERYRPLLLTMEQDIPVQPVKADEVRHSFVYYLERTGRAAVDASRRGYEMLGFLGRVTVETIEGVFYPPKELPFPALIHQIEETGLTALPIVGLLAFLVGIVLAYQGADQLKRFGAEIYTIDFLGVGFLRELGGLITAIVVAGRSGSAFTAQIGTMRVNEEVDAMQTLGMNVTEILVVPRVLGLMIALPLLTFYADFVGIVGGMVMTYFNLGITIPAFMRELTSAITLNTLLVGLIKAPVFAFVIGLVGCFEGLKVERNAASVGLLTTRSVVESIFLVIVCDAGFSVLFSKLGI